MHPKSITRHLSYANMMATIGVFIALGGASYAAVALPASSVGTKQLKKSAVAGAKIKKNAISSAKVKDGSLQRGDFASGTLLQGPRGPQGLQGPKGDPGLPGQQGVKGDPGVTNVRIVTTQATVAPGESAFPKADCEAGEKLTGGGVNTPTDEVHIRDSAPHTIGLDPTPIGWGGGFVNHSAQTRTVSVRAICAS